MSQHQIIDKLRLEFEGEIKSERQVVYILVEIGKLLEHDNAKKTYPTITFYRDWVVHAKLDRSPVANSLVRLFDDYIASGNSQASDRLKALVRPLSLRDELHSYLANHNFDWPYCTDGILWKRFVKYLAGVIDETPLHYFLGKRAKKTNFVESITVSRRRNLNGMAMLTWHADCHTPPPGGVETDIEVVMLPDFDDVALP